MNRGGINIKSADLKSIKGKRRFRIITACILLFVSIFLCVFSIVSNVVYAAENEGNWQDYSFNVSYTNTYLNSSRADESYTMSYTINISLDIDHCAIICQQDASHRYIQIVQGGDHWLLGGEANVFYSGYEGEYFKINSVSGTITYPEDSESNSAIYDLSNINPTGSPKYAANYVIWDNDTLKTQFVTNIPTYITDGLSISLDDFFVEFVQGGVAPDSGFMYWDTSNHYDYTSVYTSSITAPNVRYAGVGYNYVNDDYIYDIKYIVPDTDVSDYYTELWLDIPTGCDESGNTEYRKVCVATMKTLDLYKQNTIQVSSDTGDGWSSVDKGFYYQIKHLWSDYVGKYCSVEMAIQYNGCVAYLRNAVYLSDNTALVSDYAYFNLNPNDVTFQDGGATSSRPVIYNASGDKFNENGANINDTTNDKTNVNSSDFDYIGGLSDEAKDYIHNDGTESEKGGLVGDTSYDTNWTSDDFLSWVKGGFGLLGENGLISMITKTLSFFPSDVMNMIFWFIMIAIIIAGIKLIF